jgi:hypothetical protein
MELVAGQAHGCIRLVERRMQDAATDGGDSMWAAWTYRDARLGRDDWRRYAERLGAVEGRRAGLLRTKIEAAIATVPPTDGDAIVLALTGVDRALLRAIDQEELDALLVRPTPGDPPPPAR